MNTVKLIIALALLIFTASSPALAETTLPNTGTYFIISRSTGEALQPEAASLGQSVFLSPFDKGGMQKWSITRLVDPKTKKPTNRYTIRLAGEIPGLELQPHPVINDRTEIISTGKSIFVFQPKGDALQLKSVAKNGDAMFIYPSPNAKTEVHVGPSDDSDKFLWDLQAAN